ncbi:hypothetical protein D6C91_04300 [Aureobasidium pullulans]|uniref:MYND-type domain-containing protein n=1 Tax=Aureobasidium pullulans TaxID=5580 RepID=A0A4S9TBQ0_AURPU|nr:hypothetical protein D6D15_02841 [Aureobasidium pullulans]THZ21698.1 hypothetical protein D6C91_04300 [Aureobasidium pullulans]
MAPLIITSPEKSRSELSTQNVDSITDDLSNIALATSNSDNSIENQSNDLTNEEVCVIDLDDLCGNYLSTGESNYVADNKISAANNEDVSETKAFTNQSDDILDTKVSWAKSDKKKCTNCGGTAPNSHCAGCHQAPSIDGTLHASVQYCGRECQKAHWSVHRKECKNLQARKALFRAGALLQEMWYTIRRESFDNAVVGVEELDGALLVYEGDYNVEPAMREGGFYRKFPEAIFENKEDAESCLSLLYCNDSLNHMHQVVEWLLKGKWTANHSSKCLVKVITPVRPTRYARDEWDLDWFHHIFKAVLPSGETYAIDLTGAQYGWYEPIIHWAKYMERCKQVITPTKEGAPLGNMAHTMLSATFSDARDDRTDMQRAIPMCGECLKLQFNQAFANVRERYISGYSLLRLPQPAFKEAEEEILSMAKRITRDSAEKVDELFPVILGNTQNANQMMIEHPEMPKGQLLAYHLIQLAAAFNGDWERDAITGRLVPVTMKRMAEDDEYIDKLKSGKLPEQKAWSDMTLLYE